jgi:uncharacterized protein YkwD
MKRIIQTTYYAFIFVTLAVTLSCNSRSLDAPGVPQKTQTSAPIQKQRLRIATTTMEKLIHDRINQERSKRGLPTIRWDDALGRVARKHSKDMAARNYFSHTSPEGHDYSYRYEKNGYACGITVDGVIQTGAENIFQITLNSLPSVVEGEPQYDKIIRENIAASTIQEWMSEQDERKNILSPVWQHEGIGVSVGPENRVFITLNFC